MIKRSLAIIVIYCLSGCATVTQISQLPQPPQTEYASFPLPNCQPEMENASYWISKYKNKNQRLITLRDIEKINESNFSRGLMTDVFSDRLWDYRYVEVDWPELDNPEWEADFEKARVYSPGVLEGYTLYTYLKDETTRIKRKRRWNEDGRPIPKIVFTNLDKQLNLRGIREDNPIHYGITLRRTNVRYYPTVMTATGRRWDVNFDILQVSSIRAMEPVAILHTSLDAQWFFVVTPFCRGWVKAKDILKECNPKELDQFLNPERFLVVTGHVIEAWDKPSDKQAGERFYMGTRLPLLETTNLWFAIGLPQISNNKKLEYRNMYIPRHAQVQEGFLPCTPSLICRQAFRLLETPYSWGGKTEFRDCSQFIMDIFATMGLKLPRNSSAQAMVGSKKLKLKGYDLIERQEILKQLNRPAVLQFPGHIMLYLGEEDGHHYTIHDIWSFRRPGDSDTAKDKKVVIGKVVVSDLSLGESSKRGSLLKRLSTVNIFKP